MAFAEEGTCRIKLCCFP